MISRNARSMVSIDSRLDQVAARAYGDAARRVRFATLDDGYAGATVDDVLLHCKSLLRGEKPRAQPRRVRRIPGIIWWIRGARDEWRMRDSSARR